MILFWVYHRYWVHPSVFQSPPGLLHSGESQAKPLLAPGILAGRSNMQISMLPSPSSPSSQLSHRKKKKNGIPYFPFFHPGCLFIGILISNMYEKILHINWIGFHPLSWPAIAAGPPGRGRRFRLGFRRKMGTFG